MILRNTIIITTMAILVGLAAIASCTKQVTPTNASTPIAVPNFEHDLPRGTSSNDVDAYFKKSGLEYSFDKRTNAYYAIIRDIEGDLLVKKSIQIIVKMDGSEKVAEVLVKPVYTGP